MYKASADVVLPTSIIGSLPRPSWYDAVLGSRSFLAAMSDSRYREQYEDAVSCFLRAQEIAGLDICTDGDAHYDEQVAGMSWQSYPLTHMDGFAEVPQPTAYKIGAVAYPRGHILHDFLEARVFPKIVGPVGRGRLQYTAMWKAAQRMTGRPVKFGTILPELLAASVEDAYYKDPIERTWALSNALNEELEDLASAGCPVIQMEEPQIHMLAGRARVVGDAITAEFMVDVFNNTVKGLTDKTEVWCHTCWGNPSAQRMFDEIPSYLPGLELLSQIDADVITFETRSAGPGELEAIGKTITDKKIGIGMIDHHTLQVEQPSEVADLAREALEHIPAERLILTSDCGMGREGMPRRHAFYKIVSLVLGANIVREEAGIPTVPVRAADPEFSFVRTSA
jgi:5-methyltetrahydropteroyltriglutamate--homocysteine methyltransferase